MTRRLLKLTALSLILVLAWFSLAFAIRMATQPDTTGQVQSAAATPAPAQTCYRDAIAVGELLVLTNTERAHAGLAPLTMNQRLATSATLKVGDMITTHYWAHVSPAGATPWAWFNQAGYIYAYAGENLAEDFATSAAVIDGWMNSPTHRAAMLSPNYTEVGFSVACGTSNHETTLIVGHYASPQ